METKTYEELLREAQGDLERVKATRGMFADKVEAFEATLGAIKEKAKDTLRGYSGYIPESANEWPACDALRQIGEWAGAGTLEFVKEEAERAAARERRLTSELLIIAMASRANFSCAEDFMEWAQNRARAAIGLSPKEV